MDMDTAELNNTHIAERVDAQTQTDLTLSQKLTPIAHHELQPESAAQLAQPPPPPPSSTTTTNTPLDKVDKDILRWKDVHFLRDFGDWFNPEKAVQPTRTRLLSSCGYHDPNSPLDLDLDVVDDHGNSPPLDPVETSDTSIPDQSERALVSPDTNVERDFGQCFTPKAEDTTAVGHTDTNTTTINTDTDTISTGSTQTARSPTVTVYPSLDAASVGNNPDSDSDPTVSSGTD